MMLGAGLSPSLGVLGTSPFWGSNRPRRAVFAKRESPLPGAFALSGPAAWYMHPLDGNHVHEGTIPMTIPMERVENRILTIRGHRVMRRKL